MTHAMELATTYDRSVLAFQHGDVSTLSQFEQWLHVFWVDSSPNATGRFVACSRPCDEGRRIDWSESKTIVYGLIPGQEGCFRVPVEAFLPSEFVRQTSDQPVTRMARRRSDLALPAGD